MEIQILEVIERLSGKTGNNLNLHSAAAREKLAKEITNVVTQNINQYTPPPTP